MESNEQFSFHFLGGVGTVTGSKTLIECNGLRVLIDWLRNFTNTPTTIFLNHGEPHQSDALRVKIEDEFGWHCEVPHMNDKFTIDL